MIMKAVQITSYDGPLGTLEYGETSDPTPAAGQIAINVHYAGASYVEALFAGGFVPTIPVPWVPGLEASGTV
jgi:oxidoreductase, zinc-binding dehydrogenase family